jgi:hypothetical protein
MRNLWRWRFNELLQKHWSNLNNRQNNQQKMKLPSRPFVKCLLRWKFEPQLDTRTLSPNIPEEEGQTILIPFGGKANRILCIYFLSEWWIETWSQADAPVY